MFREHYSKEPTKGLPEADVAVKMWRVASLKKSVLLAYKTRWKIICDVQPYATIAPAFLYYGNFDREYYHRVAL